MNRIAPIHPENATGATKEHLEGVQKKLGMVPNMMRTMATAPKVLEGYLQLSGALGGGTLPAKVREQIALTVAQANGCEYCLAAHTAIGGMVGLSAEQIYDSRVGTAVDSRTNAILMLAHAIVNERGNLDDAQFQAARNAGLDDTAMAEVAANVALNVFTNYFNNLARTEVDFPAVAPIEVAPTGASNAVGHSR